MSRLAKHEPPAGLGLDASCPEQIIEQRRAKGYTRQSPARPGLSLPGCGGWRISGVGGRVQWSGGWVKPLNPNGGVLVVGGVTPPDSSQKISPVCDKAVFSGAGSPTDAFPHPAAAKHPVSSFGRRLQLAGTGRWNTWDSHSRVPSRQAPFECPIQPRMHCIPAGCNSIRCKSGKHPGPG